MPAPNAILGALKTMMGSPHLCSRRWIWEQYDHMVMGDTVQRPGGDAGVVRVHGTSKALAVTCDVTPRYVAADPVMGTKQAVVETWRNLIAVGADPLAITDNMNFGNPERPEIMGQFVGAIAGHGRGLPGARLPGRVRQRLALQRDQRRRHPADARHRRRRPDPRRGRTWPTSLSKGEGDLLVAIGREAGHLGQSLYQLIVTGKLEGAPPPVDLADEIKAGNLVRALIREGKVRAVHDVSDGGLLVAIAEMALAGGIGVQLFPYEGKLPAHAAWFGEDQGRYVLEAAPELAEEILERARLLALPARVVGRIGGDGLTLKGEDRLGLASLQSAHEHWLPDYMAAP